VGGFNSAMTHVLKIGALDRQVWATVEVCWICSFSIYPSEHLNRIGQNLPSSDTTERK